MAIRHDSKHCPSPVFLEGAHFDSLGESLFFVLNESGGAGGCGISDSIEYATWVLETRGRAESYLLANDCLVFAAPKRPGSKHCPSPVTLEDAHFGGLRESLFFVLDESGGLKRA